MIKLIIIAVVIGIMILLLADKFFRNAPKHFKGKLKPLEKAIFLELENQLADPVKKLIPLQLAQLNKGCRLYFPKSFVLELYEDKNDPIKTEDEFPRKDNYKLATISFIIRDKKFSAEITTHAGRISGITIRPAARRYLGHKHFELVKFKINNDPMEHIDLGVIDEYFEPGEIFSGDMNDLCHKYQLQQIKKPIPEKQRNIFIKLSETKWPADFLGLLEQTNGFTLGETTVTGLGNFEPVSMDTGNYLTLAENASGQLMIRQSKRLTILKYFPYEDETGIKDLGDQFIPALEKFLQLTA